MTQLYEEALAVRTLAAELSGEDLELSIESETGFTECAEAVLSAIRDAEMLRDAALARAKEIEARAAILARRAERLRDVLLGAMATAGVRTLKLVEGTVTASEGCPRVVVLEEDRIPDRYWTTEEVRTLDRRALLADLKQGHVEGATLDNVKPRLTIRTK